MRRFFAGLLGFLGILSIILGVTAAWARDTVIPTDAFVQTASDILSDETVQDTIIDQTVEQIFTLDEVNDAITEAIPENLQTFEGPILAGAKTITKEALGVIITAEKLGNLLEAGVRNVHTDLIEGEDLTLSVSDLVETLGLTSNEGVVGQATSLIPEGFGTITLLERDDAPQLYAAVDLLKDLATWLWILGIVLVASSIALAPSRRKWVAGLGFAITAVAIIYLIIVAVLRNTVVGLAPSSVRDAVDVVAEILASDLINRLVLIGVLGGIAGLVAALWGRAGIIPAVRRATSGLGDRVAEHRASLAAARAEGDTEAPEPPTSWWGRLRENAHAFWQGLDLDSRFARLAVVTSQNIERLRAAGIAAIAILLILWPSPTARVTTVLIALGILYLAALEVLQWRAKQEPEVTPALATAGEGPAVAATAAGEPAPAVTTPAATTKGTEEEAKEATEEKAEPAPPAGPPMSQSDRLEALMKLGEVRDAGILTDDEFAAEKERILQA